MRGEPAPAGFRLERHEALDSTNDRLRDYALEGEPEGLVVVAGEQLRGRGRHGRSWRSPRGNLYASLLLRPAVPLAQAATLSLVTGLSVVGALTARLGPEAGFRVKWPNDILLNGAKLGGILLDGADDGRGGCAWLVIGLGVNLASAPADTPYPAISLAPMGLAMTPDAFLEAWLPVFRACLERWSRGGFACLRAEWLERAAGLGSAVVLRVGDDVRRGTFAGLDEDGALLLDDGAGQSRRFTAGELFFP